MILFGNKSDLEANRQVTVDMAEEYAKEIGAEHVQMSALSNEGMGRVDSVPLGTAGCQGFSLFDKIIA